MSLRSWWKSNNSVKDILGRKDVDVDGLVDSVADILMDFKDEFREEVKRELLARIPEPYGEQAWEVVDEVL